MILGLRSLSLKKSAAASIVRSAETCTTTRWIDPAADLREATKRNSREVREEREAFRLKKAEANKAEDAALKKLAEAEAADAAKKHAEEVVHRQSAVFVVPLNSAPPRRRLGKPAASTLLWKGTAATSPCRMSSCPATSF